MQKEQTHWLSPPIAFLTRQIALIERCLEYEEACYLCRVWTPMGSHRATVKGNGEVLLNPLKLGI